MNRPARIAILFETSQDFQIVKRHLERLTEWEVPYVITLASALKGPERLARWIAECEREGAEVFVVAAGGAANLAGAVAAQTDYPVIGVPLDTTHLRGQDALHAMTGLPAGLPVATVGINNVENAFYCALRVLALRHPDYGALLRRLRAAWGRQEIELLNNLRDQYPEYFVAELGAGTAPTVGRPIEVTPELKANHMSPPQNEEAAPDSASRPPPESKNKPTDQPVTVAPPRRPARRIVVNPTQPDVAAIEEVADILLEGGIVALPTDTVYGLAAVATNSNAVRRLYQIKGRESGKPIPLLIHSTRGLSRLVREVPEAAHKLLESHWPGALTLVFSKYPGSFAELSSDNTIGLRMPDHTVTLAVISMLARPLAVTSANLSGKPPALTADDVIESFGNAIECVLDAGRTPGEKVSTVLSLVESPYRILREGAVSFSDLKAILGEHLAEG
jgi:tRNA threonylcarbamoyl adenosine modification protein (Sua5/YciO/YrdC/YwlC family)